MSAPLVPMLNPSGVNRNTMVEVKIAGVYTPIGGVKNFDPTTDNANMVDDTRYSDGGYARQNKVGTGWSATCVVARASTIADGTSYDAAQEYLRSRGEGQLGVNAQVDIRWYEYDPATGTPRIEAKQGLALVTYKGPGGDGPTVREATFTFDGQGALNTIAHPYPQTPTAPTITTLLPSTMVASGSAGKQVIISGSGFTTTITNGVKFSGANALSYVVESDSRIVASVPTLTAGAVTVTVQNATGTSSAATLTAT